MTDFENRIDNLELRARESKLIADLALDPEVRVYNTDLARKLKDEADRLKRSAVAQAEQGTVLRKCELGSVAAIYRPSVVSSLSAWHVAFIGDAHTHRARAFLSRGERSHENAASFHTKAEFRRTLLQRGGASAHGCRNTSAGR